MKEKYTYILLDKNNDVQIMIPISGGEEISQDNTCKSTEVMKEFISGKKRTVHLIG